MTQWDCVVEAHDETGQPEEWLFAFRRLTARTLTEVQAFAASVDDAFTGDVLAELVDRVTRSVSVNGVVVDDLGDVPVEVLAQAPGLHPSFRDDPPSEGD